MKFKRKKLLIIGGILYVLLALLIRIYYLVDFSSLPIFDIPRGPDVEEYCSWAKEIIAGRILWPYVYIHAPLYPFFLAFLYLCFANLSGCFFWIRFTQIMIGFIAFIPLLGVIKLIYQEKYGKDLNKRKKRFFQNSLIFLLLWGWYPPLIYYLGELTSEVLIIPLLSTAIFLIYLAESGLFHQKKETEPDTSGNEELPEKSQKPHTHPKTKNFYLALAGICCGLASIAHPLSLFFLFSEIIYLYLKRNFKGLAFFGIFSILMILPVSCYNMLVLHESIPIQANGGFNLYLGNNEQADGTCMLRPGPEWDDFHLGADYQSRKLGISKDSLLIQKTVKFILKNPLQWFKLLLNKSFYVWNHREITSGADLYPLRYHTTYQKIFSWSFGFCAVLALAAVFMNLKKWKFYKRHRHILILIGSFWIAQTLLVTSGRYRISMVPAMLILSAWTLSNFIHFIKERPGNNIRLALSLIAALGIVYIPNPPFNKSREEGEAASILGEAYLIKKDYIKAEENLLIAAEKLPAWSRNFNLLGVLMEKKGNDKAALQYYLKAMKSASSDPDSFMNIALLYSRKNKKEIAIDFFIKAFSVQKRPTAELYYNFAVFCFEQGQKDKAMMSYEKCLELNPAHERALNNVGIILFTLGKYPEAAKFFKKALTLDPLNAKRMVNLAAVEFAMGNKNESNTIIDRALKLNPNLNTAKELKTKINK